MINPLLRSVERVVVKFRHCVFQTDRLEFLQKGSWSRPQQMKHFPGAGTVNSHSTLEFEALRRYHQQVVIEMRPQTTYLFTCSPITFSFPFRYV